MMGMVHYDESIESIAVQVKEIKISVGSGDCVLMAWIALVVPPPLVVVVGGCGQPPLIFAFAALK